jgi:hypothetical protein
MWLCYGSAHCLFSWRMAAWECALAMPCPSNHHQASGDDYWTQITFFERETRQWNVATFGERCERNDPRPMDFAFSRPRRVCICVSRRNQIIHAGSGIAIIDHCGTRRVRARAYIWALACFLGTTCMLLLPTTSSVMESEQSMWPRGSTA